MTDPELIRRFEEWGPDVVRARLGQLPHTDADAITWLAQKDREALRAAAASAAEQMDLARSASNAALEANELAREANSIARDASSSADRSARAAQTNNKIAVAALITAIIAIVVSIIGLAHTGDHGDTTKTEAQGKAH